MDYLSGEIENEVLISETPQQLRERLSRIYRALDRVYFEPRRVFMASLRDPEGHISRELLRIREEQRLIVRYYEHPQHVVPEPHSQAELLDLYERDMARLQRAEDELLAKRRYAIKLLETGEIN